MKKIKRGDIVCFSKDINVNLGKGVLHLKDRPFLVISNDLNNKLASTVNVAALTKNTEKDYPMHVFLDKKKYNLCYNSNALLEHVFTVDKNAVKYVIGSLDSEDLKNVDKAVLTQFFNKNDMHC